MFQELVEVVNNNIVLRKDVEKASVKTNENIINNVLATIFHEKYMHKAPEHLKDKKDYKLGLILVGSSLYSLLKHDFELDEYYKIFDVLVMEDKSFKDYAVQFRYTWIAFEMGGPRKESDDNA